MHVYIGIQVHSIILYSSVVKACVVLWMWPVKISYAASLTCIDGSTLEHVGRNLMCRWPDNMYINTGI